MMQGRMLDESQSQDLFKIRFKTMQSEQPEQQGGKYNLLAKTLSENISRILTIQLSHLVQIVSTFSFIQVLR